MEDLARFLAIQSVSTDPRRFCEVLSAVDFLKGKLEAMGFDVRVEKKEKTPPFLIASRFVSDSAETIGIYGHYDVQPEDPIEQWDTRPFELTRKNGKLYGRGVADDKAHIIQSIAAVDRLIKTGRLKKNMIFVIEGEEEVGSTHFEEYVERAKERSSKVDVFFVIDVGMRDKKTPQIFYGLRGLLYFELRIQTGEIDLHSGVYGNRVINPAQVLSTLLAGMKDPVTGKVTIPRFYDRVRNIPKDELKILKKTVRSEEDEKKEACVYRIVSQGDIPPSLVTKVVPSLDINGLYSGYIKEGTKTIIPSYASVKFSCRLVERQTPQEIESLVRDYVQRHIPAGVKHTLVTLEKSPPFYTNINNIYMKKTAQILTDYFGSETLFNRSGASIGAAEVLGRVFKKPVVLTGFTLPDENIHAPNENFDEELFYKGIEALVRIYSDV